MLWILVFAALVSVTGVMEWRSHQRPLPPGVVDAWQARDAERRRQQRQVRRDRWRRALAESVRPVRRTPRRAASGDAAHG